MKKRLVAFTTRRLQMASWTDSLRNSAQRQRLADELVIILTPDVLHHLPAPLHLSGGPHSLDRWISDREAQSDVFMVRLRGPDTLIGLLILAPVREPEAETTIHLGYLFAGHAWGKGYATELLQGLVAAQIDQGGPAILLAGVAKGNVASARVLLKTGFHLDANSSTRQADMFRYDI